MTLQKIYFSIFVALWLIPQDSFSQMSDTSNRKGTFLFTDFLTNQKKIDTVAVINKLDFYNYFKIIECTSGYLYFSGDGFLKIISLRYNGNIDELKAYFDRCVTGSRFTMEKCLITQDGGLKPMSLSKSVLFL